MGELTFLTYNILDGGRGREVDLKRVISAQDADVVVLQEVMGESFVQELAASLRWNWFVAESNSRRTIALLTRYPIQSARSYHPSLLRNTCLYGVVEYAPSKTISLYGIHLCAPPYVLPFEMYRLLELKSIFRLVTETRSDKMVMAGDLNSIAHGDKPDFKPLPLSLQFSLLLHGGYVAHQVVDLIRARGFVDVYRALNPKENGYTLPAAQPNTRLDYLFVNDELQANVRASTVVTSPESVRHASDHLPVRMEIEL